MFPKILVGKDQGQRSVEGVFCKAERTSSLPFGAEKASLPGALLAFRGMEQDRCLLLSVLRPRQTSWGLMQALPRLFPMSGAPSSCVRSDRQGPQVQGAFQPLAGIRNSGGQYMGHRVGGTACVSIPEKRLSAPKCAPPKATSQYQGHQPGPE